MKNNNELQGANRLKTKAAELISDALIEQADKGMKNTGLWFLSEPKVPAELLLEEDTE